MQGKENGPKMTGRENKAISPAGRTSARRSMNESKRTANSQELVGSPSKRSETRALIPSLSSRFCSPDFPSLKKRGQCDDMSRSQKKRKPNQQSDVISDALSEISLPPPTSDRVRSSSPPRELREIYRYTDTPSSRYALIRRQTSGHQLVACALLDEAFCNLRAMAYPYRWFWRVFANASSRDEIKAPRRNITAESQQGIEYRAMAVFSGPRDMISRALHDMLWSPRTWMAKWRL
jgi:hypothetical protein